MLYVPYKSVPGGKYCSIRTYSDILYRYRQLTQMHLKFQVYTSHTIFTLGIVDL